MEGIGKYVIELIFQPGSSLRLVPAINGSLCCLLVVLGLLGYYGTIDSIHVKVMSGLSVGLMASVSWFAQEFRKAKALQDKFEANKAAQQAAEGEEDKDREDSRPKED